MGILTTLTTVLKANSVTFCGSLLVCAAIVDTILKMLRGLISKNCMTAEIEAFFGDQEMRDRDLLDWIAENMTQEELLEILELDMYELVEALEQHIKQSDNLPIIEMKRRGLLE